MRSIFARSSQLAGATLAATLVLVGCAPMAPNQGSYVLPPMGSNWVMARTNSGSYGAASVQVTTSRGEQMWQGEQVASFEEPGFVQLLRANGNLIAFLGGGKPVAIFDPEVRVSRPFEVGKTVTTNHQVTLPGRTEPMPLQITQKVEAYEDVTVPAGTFKTFRVSWSESTGVENTYWVSPELGITVKSILTRTAKFPSGPGKRENELVSQTIKK